MKKLVERERGSLHIAQDSVVFFCLVFQCFVVVVDTLGGMFVFAYAYTLDGFLDNYVYQHLLMYPLIIIIIAIVMVLGIRYKGSFFVDLVADNKKKYYTRINYRVLTGITIATVATICILLLVGVLYNTTMSEKLDNTIDTVFGAAMHTSENIQKVNTSLIALQARLRAGISGSPLINASQEAIIGNVNVVNAQLTELSTYLSNFSASMAQSAANASAQARGILISLQNYPQLSNIPDPSEVPLINENQIESDFDDAQESIVEAKNELGRIRNEVSAVGNVSYDFSSVISSITSARRSLVDVNKQVLDLYDKKDGMKKDVKYFDRIRIGIIVLTYVFPLLIAVAGLLAIEMRTSSVVRAWYHILLVGAALCGIFAGIYMAISIVIEDACHDTETTLFVALRSAYPDYDERKWYQDLVEYYPLVTNCNSTDDILDYLDLPAEFLTALENPSSLIANVSIDYTALLANATNKLDSGLDSIRDIDYTALDSGGIKAKLVNVQQQLTNLTAFGFSMSLYNAALKRINDQTNSVPVTYPDGTTAILSFIYAAAQVSSIDLGADPYVYTTQSYRNQLNASINDFLELDQQYKDTVILTSGISANITRLIGIIDELEDYSGALRVFQAGVDQRGSQIRKSMNNIGSGVSDLTTNVIPGALGITATRDVVIAATRCLYITAAYKAAENFVCNSAMDASAAYIATHSLAGCALLVANVAAGYAFIAFGFPYKPYSHSPYIHFTAEDEHSISFSTSLALRSYPYYALSPKRGYKYMLL